MNKMKSLKTGLKKYIDWSEGFEKRAGSDYYNDGYDQTKQKAIRLLRILDWLDGTSHRYDYHVFSERSDIVDILLIDGTEEDNYY